MPQYEKAQAAAGQDTAGHRPNSATAATPAPHTAPLDDAVRHLQDTMLNAATALQAFRNALAIVNAQSRDVAQRLGRRA